MADIKAIETEYGGFRFRSRLEARWAVFFDRIGAAFEYEPEGFSGDGFKYLPDFYLPSFDAYVEIKPRPGPTAADLAKCVWFGSQKRLLLFIGSPCEADFFLVDDNSSLDEFLQESAGDGQSADTAAASYPWAAFTQVEWLLDGFSNAATLVRVHYGKIHGAATFAKRARFEFGQTPSRPQI